VALGFELRVSLLLGRLSYHLSHSISLGTFFEKDKHTNKKILLKMPGWGLSIYIFNMLHNGSDTRLRTTAIVGVISIISKKCPFIFLF
jgi:hypothetical protein